MNPARSPEFRLIKKYEKLEAGTFVKPINLEYLSQERKDEFKYRDLRQVAICWTPLGFMTIPRNLIEEIPW